MNTERVQLSHMLNILPKVIPKWILTVTKGGGHISTVYRLNP